ncbi:MAG: phosphatase PAP2 family protein [Armatimonadota bacterium]
MNIDFWLLDLINGLAGRWGWLDNAGRLLAVFGLLAVLLVVLALLWWPRWSGEQRRQYVLSTVLATAGCAALMVVEWLVTTHLLHHEIRTRPSYSRWVTVLITAQTPLSFPAWPVVLTFALVPATRRLAKLPALIIATFAGLLGFALVFVGVNYPFDVITAIILGLAVGCTTSACVGIGGHPWRNTLLLWLVLCVWGAAIGINVKVTSEEVDRGVSHVSRPEVQVTPPPGMLAQLGVKMTPATVKVAAASNGYLLVAEVRVILPDANIKPAQVVNLAREAVNTSFSAWDNLKLITVVVSASFPRNKVGTLYTATVERREWPAGGFAAGQPLPGKKFYHAQMLRETQPVHLPPSGSE